LRRALKLATVLAIHFSLCVRCCTFALGGGGAGRRHQPLLLALFDVRIPDGDDDGVRHHISEVAVHHLEDEAAVHAKVVLDEGAEQATVFGRLQFVVHLEIMADELFHALWVEDPEDPDHETDDGDDSEGEEEEGDHREDFVVVEVNGENAVTRVRQQIPVDLRRAVEFTKGPDGESLGGDELPGEDGGFDDVEAVGQDVVAEEGVHRVQLDEDVQQKRHLHSQVEVSQVVSLFRATPAVPPFGDARYFGRILFTHLPRHSQPAIQLDDQVSEHRFSRHRVALNFRQTLRTVHDVLEIHPRVLGERTPEDVRNIEQDCRESDDDGDPLVVGDVHFFPGQMSVGKVILVGHDVARTVLRSHDKSVCVLEASKGSVVSVYELISRGRPTIRIDVLLLLT